MSVGHVLTQRIMNSRASSMQPVNAKKAQALGLDTKVSQQVVSKFAAFYSDVKKLDEAASKNNQSVKVYRDNDKSSKSDRVSQFANTYAHQAIAKMQEYEHERVQSRIDKVKENMVQNLLDEIETLITKCYSGDQEAFKGLFDLRDGKFLSPNSTMIEGVDFTEVFNRAHQAIEKLIKDASDYPALLNMVMGSRFVLSSQHKELDDAPAKLMNKAAHSNKAMEIFKRMLSKGQIRLEDFAARAVDLDPSSAILTLTKLALGQRSKDQGLTAVNILSDVAEKRAGTMAGGLAVKGLKKIIKKEGDNGILRSAFEGLTKASMAGNPDALMALEDIASDPTVSKNKAFKAIECITKIAKSGSASGGKATDILIGFAKNKKLAPSIRLKSVDGLTEVAENGGSNSGKASDALLDFAKRPDTLVGNRALVNILRMKNTDKMDQSKLAKVMHNAAKSNKLDTKVKLAALNKLENIFDQNASNKGEAGSLIFDLAKHSQGQVKLRAQNKISKMGNDTPKQLVFNNQQQLNPFNRQSSLKKLNFQFN